MPLKKDLRKLTSTDLRQYFEHLGEKPYRSRQVEEWLWKKSATSIGAMTTLSKQIREQLAADFDIYPVRIHEEQVSRDGTIKSSFRLFDQHLIEGVLIPTDSRMTACISSQIGCSLSCKFCATGYMDRIRNLDAAEIYDQVVLINRQSLETNGKPLSNIVYMGMGEPLLNYKNVLDSVDLITAPHGLGMSPKRITVSTAGIAKMIHKLADDGVKFNLALSLHAANERKRNQIMPINESNNLNVLQKALAYFAKSSPGDLTLEYILFHQFNDSLEDARELHAFASHLPVKINIIEYNPIQEAQFANASGDRIDAFAQYLKKKGLIVNVRRSRGKDIDAACGQLANK